MSRVGWMDFRRLSLCYQNCLKIAEQYEFESIAFPCISCGKLGFHQNEAAEVAVDSVLNFIFKKQKSYIVPSSRYKVLSKSHLSTQSQLSSKESNFNSNTFFEQYAEQSSTTNLGSNTDLVDLSTNKNTTTTNSITSTNNDTIFLNTSKPTNNDESININMESLDKFMSLHDIIFVCSENDSIRAYIKMFKIIGGEILNSI
jgi:hypothetical protein